MNLPSDPEQWPKAAVIVLNENDPWLNLATEESFFELLPAGRIFLLLYVNGPCVVIGKHQNPLREVKFDRLRELGVPLLRRSSGGGTVWHDEGNLNFSFLCDKALYDRDLFHKILVESLRRLSLNVRGGEKGDLLFGEKKVSGNAFIFKRNKVLHHGTLLCSANLERLRSVLGATGTLIEWVGVESRPMSVVNLVDLPPKGQGNLDVVRKSLSDVFREQFEASVVTLGNVEANSFFGECRTAILNRLKSADWLWERTPDFLWEGETLVGGLRVRVSDGRVMSAEVLHKDVAGSVATGLVGRSLFSSDFFEGF